jgi:hypothetical protein
VSLTHWISEVTNLLWKKDAAAAVGLAGKQDRGSVCYQMAIIAVQIAMVAFFNSAASASSLQLHAFNQQQHPSLKYATRCSLLPVTVATTCGSIYRYSWLRYTTTKHASSKVCQEYRPLEAGSTANAILTHATTSVAPYPIQRSSSIIQ